MIYFKKKHINYFFFKKIKLNKSKIRLKLLVKFISKVRKIIKFL